MKTFAQLFFENNTFIVNSGILKKYELVTLVKNFKYMIEFMTSFPIRKDKND